MSTSGESDDDGAVTKLIDDDWGEPIPYPSFADEEPPAPSGRPASQRPPAAGPSAGSSSEPPQRHQKWPDDAPEAPEPKAIIVDDNEAGEHKIIVGPDNRKLVENLVMSPWSAVCLLAVTHENGRRTTATGFLIRSSLVATAAHVIHNPDPAYGRARSINVVPGFLQPPGRRRAQTSTNFRTHARWGASPGKAFKPWYDYGAILLDDHAKFEIFGTFYMSILSVSDLLARELSLSGYPGEVPKKGRQYVGLGRVREQLDASHETFFHTIDSTPGQSGAPIFYVNDGHAVAVGIHSKAASASANRNVGRRVMQDMVHDYSQWYASHISSVPMV